MTTADWSLLKLSSGVTMTTMMMMMMMMLDATALH